MIEQVWPARMAFPPSAPYLGAVFTRAEFAATAAAMYSKTESPSRESDLAELQQAVADYNASIPSNACGPAGWGVIAAMWARRWCTEQCESYGGVVSAFSFDSANCQILQCSCAGADSPRPPKGPLDFVPWPFEDVLDEDHWNQEDGSW